MRATGRPAQRYLALIAVTTLAVFAVDRTEVLASFLNPVADCTATAVMFALNSLEIHASREALVISSPGGFAYEIHYRCTGFLPTAILIIAILAYPAPRREKVIGLAATIPLLLAVNFVRLVDLFAIGVSRPEAFPLAHEVIWQTAMGLAVIGLWAAWSGWARARARECGH